MTQCKTGFLKGKKVLVTGACGTVGSTLVEQLLREGHDPEEVIGIDNNENNLFFLEQRFLSDHRARFFLADVRDRDKLSKVCRGIDIIFHAAAFKHVVLCERSPNEAVQTNIMGVQNIIWAATDNNVEKVLFTSSDKAVNPTNVMGTSKLMGERIMTAANSNGRDGGPLFASTRFGNVMGSRGSVIPIFREQIANGGPVTLTDPGMTRFIMSKDEAVRLVIKSAEIARGGAVFITKMPVIRIKDLAEVMIEELAAECGYSPEDIAISEIGTKPGEKLYEELMSEEEIRRTIELPQYFVVLPAFRGIYQNISYDYPDIVSDQINNPYNSSNAVPMSKGQLLDFLKKNKLLESEEDTKEFKRYWPGEKVE